MSRFFGKTPIVASLRKGAPEGMLAGCFETLIYCCPERVAVSGGAGRSGARVLRRTIRRTMFCGSMALRQLHADPPASFSPHPCLRWMKHEATPLMAGDHFAIQQAPSCRDNQLIVFCAEENVICYLNSI